MSDDPVARAMVRESSKLSILTLISRLLGLFREMTKAAFLGTAGISDAFTVAFMIPNFLRRLFAEGSMAAAFIPTFKEYLVKGDEEKTKSFLSASFTVLSVLVALTVGLGILCAPMIVKLFGSEPYETAILTRIMFPFLALVSVAAFLQGILNSVNVFTPTGIAPILFNLCFIVIPMLIAPFMENPARAMAVAVVAGGVAQALCQLPAVLKRGFHFGFMDLREAFRNPGMRKVLALIAPTILGMAAYQVNDLVSTSLASNAGTGVASSLQFSLRLQELILGVFAVSIGTVLLPELSDCVKRTDWSAFNRRLRKGMDAIAVITIPLTLLSMIEAKDIVIILFKMRAFSDESVSLTVRAFTYHIAGLYFIAMNRVIAPAFYAGGDTKSPTLAGIVSFGANIVLALFLVVPMAGGGLALALSLSSSANTGILVGLLRKKEGIEFKGTVIGMGLYALKILVFSLVAALPTYFLSGPVHALFSGSGNRFISSGIPFVLLSMIFGTIGLSLLLATKDENAAYVVRIFGKRKSRS